jgi:hypothetical protein
VRTCAPAYPAARLAQRGAYAAPGFLVAPAGTAGGAWDSLFTVPYLAEQAPAVLDRPTPGSLLARYVVSYLVLAVGVALAGRALLR